jgi:hypothetical protein
MQAGLKVQELLASEATPEEVCRSCLKLIPEILALAAKLPARAAKWKPFSAKSNASNK